MRCLQGPSVVLRACLTLVGWHTGQLSRRPHSTAVRPHMGPLRAKSRRWELWAQKSWAQHSTRCTQCLRSQVPQARLGPGRDQTNVMGVKGCVAIFSGLMRPCRLGSVQCARDGNGAEAHSDPVWPLEKREWPQGCS